MNDDLKRVLEAADVPRRPTPDELDRIRTAVFEGRSHTADLSDLERDVFVVDDDELSARPAARRLLLRAMAAAVLLVVGSLALLRLADTNDLLEVASTPESRPTQACAALQDLVNAFEAWGGGEAWASLAQTDPNLAQLVLNVLVELDQDPAVVGAVEQLEEVTADTQVGRNSVARSAAVGAGVKLIVDRIGPYDDPSSCPVDPLRIHAGG